MSTNRRSTNRLNNRLSSSQPTAVNLARRNNDFSLTRQEENNLLGINQGPSPNNNMDTGQSPSVTGNASQSRDTVSEHPLLSSNITDASNTQNTGELNADEFKRQLIDTIQLRGPEQG